MSKIVGMDGKSPGLQIDPSMLKDICCDQCGGRYFRAVNAFKRISALVSPTGKEQIIPVPTYGDSAFIYRVYYFDKEARHGNVKIISSSELFSDFTFDTTTWKVTPK